MSTEGVGSTPFRNSVSEIENYHKRSGPFGSSSQKYVGSLGHARDRSTGLIYMRARYMDPVLGRFISEDPAKNGPNWFAYCGDEPVQNVDSSGQSINDDPLLYDCWFYLTGWIFVIAACYKMYRSASKASIITTRGELRLSFATGPLPNLAMAALCFSLASIGITSNSMSLAMGGIGGAPTLVAFLLDTLKEKENIRICQLTQNANLVRGSLIAAAIVAVVGEASMDLGVVISIGADAP